MSDPTRNIRKDRGYYFSLRLHESVLGHLNRNPQQVYAKGLAGAVLVKQNARGDAVIWVEEWERLLEKQDKERITEILSGSTETDVNMRSVSPFLGVLTQSERDQVLQELLRTQPWKQPGSLLDI